MRQLAIKQNYSRRIVSAFIILQGSDLLNGEHAQAIFDIITRSKNPDSDAENFVRLAEYGFLEPKFAPTIMKLMPTINSTNFTDSLITLQKKGLLKGAFAQSCFNAVVNPRLDLYWENQRYYDFAHSLATLQKTGLLQGAHAQANFDAVISHKNPSDIKKTLKWLGKCHLLTNTQAQTNFNVIIKSEEPDDINSVFSRLDKSGLLKGIHAQVNFNALVPTHANFYEVTSTLSKFHEIGLLAGAQTQTNFNKIMKYHELLTDHKDARLCRMIPPQKMTQKYFDELITICQQSELSEDEKRGQIVTSWIKTDSEVFAHAEMRGCQYIYPIIVSTLKNLHQREENRLPNTTFDLADDDESRFCFYIIRSNSKEALGEMGFLLRIPSVRALAVTESVPGENTNELLRLAVNLDNKEAASILLEIPEVKVLAKQHNYYRKADTPKSKSPESIDATPSKLGLFGQDNHEKSDAKNLSHTNISP